MSQAVYENHESWEFYQKPVYLSLAFFVLALFVAVPKDRARRMLCKHGRRLRGPELVTTAELNEKLGKSKLLTTHLPDGVSFINEEQTWTDKLFRKNLSRWARVPRDREAMHFLIVGDSGTGKSAAIRQLLAQVWERRRTSRPLRSWLRSPIGAVSLRDMMPQHGTPRMRCWLRIRKRGLSAATSPTRPRRAGWWISAS